ncbi:hypothetical protein B0J13DRAFT_511202 [Dactylonectria estremocensis]|uniref:NAD(P)-binding domain-containing protein n=1 Tax=Dactylonectria estremocensis TaxID=1079267 RepID=A0A9P9DTS0_9HYPO|nr:hypothetical protein B0J13DRAFT_511202 [Dactylonectria estremocensis]
MKFALAGSGDVGIVFAKEFAKLEDEIVILTSSPKAHLQDLKAEIRVTDYSVENLKQHLYDCDAVVSTLSGPKDSYISSHSNILEACTQSPRCKHYVPSEWNINIEDFPDQPMFSAATHEVVRTKLRSQTNVKWTMVCHGWFMQYVLPQNKNPLREIGQAWVMDHNSKVFDVYGDGSQKVTLTSLNDVANATVEVLRHSIQTGSTLPEVTHLCGETLAYKDLFALMKRRDPEWKSRPVTITEVVDAILKGLGANDPNVAVHQMRLLGFTNVNQCPEDKVLKWGEGVLQGLSATTIESLLDQADRS